ncbi:MAG: phosphatase PAP2 family protein [Ignavibacteriaceae bacterium]|nr:phosphatase PAP2 family protein [Ignavibacteriaceae bacterium]
MAIFNRILYFFLLLSVLGNCQSPYSVSDGDRAILLSAGGSLTFLSYMLDSKVEPLTDGEVSALNRNEINGFDIGATYNYSPAGALASDILLGTTALSPLLLMLSPEIKKDAAGYLMMFAEMSMFTLSATYLVKSNVKRIRPYAYNENVPLEEKTNSETRRSFFSGHASFAFASAVFVSETFAEYYPESKYKNVVRGAALLTATATGYLRYYAGRHFPSDIIAGAVVGGAIGYIIPKINKSAKSKPAENLNINFTIPL